MNLVVCVKQRRGRAASRDQLGGWPADASGPLAGPEHIRLSAGPETLRLDIDPASASVAASASSGWLHYFRLADATLRPLPAEAELALARGDAYIAVSPGGRRLADSLTLARYLHLHDGFNAGKLAEGLLDHLARESGQTEFPEDVTVIVVEAR